MPKIERYEDLKVWKLSMNLCNDIYRLTNQEKFSKDFSLKDQIRRSAISVPSNIAEGFERDNKKQFLYFLLIAKGSCGELRTQLQIALSLDYLTSDDFATINENCINTSKQLAGFINYLKNYNSDK